MPRWTEVIEPGEIGRLNRELKRRLQEGTQSGRNFLVGYPAGSFRALHAKHCCVLLACQLRQLVGSDRFADRQRHSECLKSDVPPHRLPPFWLYCETQRAPIDKAEAIGIRTNPKFVAAVLNVLL